MITESIFGIFFDLFETIFGTINEINFVVDSGILVDFLELLSVITYFFPMDVVADVLLLVLIFNAFKIVVALFKTIWDVLPIV